MTNTKNINKSLARSLEIFEKFTNKKKSWGIRELAREVKTSPATIYRTIVTLANAGYLEKNDNNDQYHLGPKILTIAESYRYSNPIRQIAKETFKKYSKVFDHNFYLGKMLNNKIIYIVTLEGNGPIIISAHPGLSIDVYCSALGKVLLAYQTEEYINNYIKNTRFKKYTKNTITDPKALLLTLENIRVRGYALNLSERYEGIGAIGFPLQKNDEKPKMAISIAYPQFFIDNNNLNLDSLIQMAEKIDKEISARL